MASTENQIMLALKTRLDGLSWVKTVAYEEIKLLWGDFNEAELPAIQIYDRPGQPATVQHQRALINVVWPLAIELVLKSNHLATVNQAELFEKKKDIEDILSQDLGFSDANAGTGIPGFQHLRYDGFETDLHSTPGMFGAFLYMSALFSREFPGC